MPGCACASRPLGRVSEPGLLSSPPGATGRLPRLVPHPSGQGSPSPDVGSRRHEPVGLPATRRARKGPGGETTGLLLKRRPCDAGTARGQARVWPQPLLPGSVPSVVCVSYWKPPPPRTRLHLLRCLHVPTSRHLLQSDWSRAVGNFRLNFWKRCGPLPCVTRLPTRLSCRVGKSVQLLPRKEPVPGNPLFIQ